VGAAARKSRLNEGGRLAVPLRGSLVELEPLRADHAEELWEAGQDPRIWEWLAPLGSDRAMFERWLAASLEDTEADREGVFATRRLADGAVVGSTRFLSVRRFDRVVEIGWTWLNPGAWAGGFNIEAKLLMLGHAFDVLDCLRVEFKTDSRNARSRGALAALPAEFEGILRKHKITPGVGVRDSAYYSVLDEEWPGVRAGLQARLRRLA
jgi:RimJ/RimL family protein N-acetyltransferase